MHRKRMRTMDKNIISNRIHESVYRKPYICFVYLLRSLYV